MKLPRRFPLLRIALCAWTLGCGDQRARAERSSDRPSNPTLTTGLDSLVAVADSLYKAGDYARAKVAWSAGLARTHGGQHFATEARILTSLGLTEWRLGDYAAARARTDQARVLLEANGPRALLPRTYNALGLIAWDEGRMSEAAELWRRTMQIAREVGDQEYVDKPAMNLGLLYAGIGDLENARRAFASSLVAGRNLAIRPLELRSLVNLAMVANQMGEPRLALAWLDSAVAAGVEEDFLADDNRRSQLAFAAWAVGDPGLALAGLDGAILRARTAGLRESEAANLSLMSDIYWEAGDLVRALELNARAETIHRELGLPSEQGQNLYNAARIQTTLGHKRQAQDLATRALKLHQRAEDPAHELDDRLLLAELGVAGQLTEARRISGKLSNRAARTKLGLAEARLAANAKRPRETLRALGAIDPDLESGLSAEVSEAEALRARAYASLKQWDSAAARGRLAIAAMERIRDRHGSGLLRASFASFRAGTYGELVAALLALNRTDEAFEVADAARGASALTTGHSVQGAHVLTRSATREEPLRRIAALENEIRNREDESLETGELHQRLRQAERDYEIAVMSGASANSSAKPQNPSAARVRDALAPDEALLSYLVTPDRLFVFTLTRQHLQVRVVPVSAVEVDARVRLARQMLSDPKIPAEEAGAVLATLSQWLLGAVGTTGLDGVQRLIVVPHGALAYLPFAALKTREGKFLVERYSLVHLPSASFTNRVGSRVFTNVPGRPQVIALAPQPEALPATALEVNAIGRSHRGTQVLLGQNAGESAVRRALRSGAITHVASHGVLNRVNPLFSRIELVAGRKKSPDDDGRLEVHEVLQLEIRSPLVFLSGCETGLGPGGSHRYTPGEDYATLAAAFLDAGARQVVATLWAIPDTGAAVFASRFYTELASTGAADALGATQRAMLSERRFRHPYYWAGYRLAGSE